MMRTHNGLPKKKNVPGQYRDYRGLSSSKITNFARSEESGIVLVVPKIPGEPTITAKALHAGRVQKSEINEWNGYAIKKETVLPIFGVLSGSVLNMKSVSWSVIVIN